MKTWKIRSSVLISQFGKFEELLLFFLNGSGAERLDYWKLL